MHVFTPYNIEPLGRYTTLRWRILKNTVQEAGASVLAYGQFIQNVVDFIIVAFCIFLMIKGMNKLTKKKEEAPAPAPEPPAPTKEETLLTEIRDLLKNK